MESVSGVLLPLNFQPSPNTVLIGRGKEPKQNCGNKRLRVLVTAFLERYQRGDKKKKTEIVTDIIGMVRESCDRDFGGGMNQAQGVGAFVKHIKKTGKWYDQSDNVAREKVGYVFRDLLADSYKSSSKRKVELRKQLERSVSVSSTVVSEETTSTPATSVCVNENNIPTTLSILSTHNINNKVEESLASSSSSTRNHDSFENLDFDDDFDDDHSFYCPPPLPSSHNNNMSLQGSTVTTKNVDNKVCTMIYYNSNSNTDEDEDFDDDISTIEEITASTTTASSVQLHQRRPSFTDLSFLDESFRSLPQNDEEEGPMIQPTTTSSSPDEDNVFSFDQLMKLPLLAA